jgi:hypothetical protein
MLTPQNRSLLIGHSFFPNLISAPFRTGLHEAFAFAIIACLVAAAASLMRGGRYYDAEDSRPHTEPGLALVHQLPAVANVDPGHGAQSTSASGTGTGTPWGEATDLDAR